ncbi:hypothetical protein P692DRAFT_20734678, partial [Suillus brevipes Sb2]
STSSTPIDDGAETSHYCCISDCHCKTCGLIGESCVSINNCPGCDNITNHNE